MDEDDQMDRVLFASVMIKHHLAPPWVDFDARKSKEEVEASLAEEDAKVEAGRVEPAPS